MKTLLLFFALFSVSYSASISTRTKSDGPKFCNGLDCPRFTVLAEKEGYEVRKYETSKWVGTTITSSDWHSSTQVGFDRLFKYISGENQGNIKVPMAAPVATKIQPGVGPGGVSNYTILFFVPFEYQSDTPVPTNPQLAIVTLPPITAYVSSFGGFESNADLEKYAERLSTDLQRDQAHFTTIPYFTAGYDSPYRFINRHNEVWFLQAKLTQ